MREITTPPTHPAPQPAEHVCYYCNEGFCGLCDGNDRTIVDGRAVTVPCAHECRRAQRKPTLRAGKADKPVRRRA